MTDVTNGHNNKLEILVRVTDEKVIITMVIVIIIVIFSYNFHSVNDKLIIM